MYTSEDQLGGAQIMVLNGVSHETVENDNNSRMSVQPQAGMLFAFVHCRLSLTLPRSTLYYAQDKFFSLIHLTRPPRPFTISIRRDSL